MSQAESSISSSEISRRGLLRLGALGLVGAGLAACGFRPQYASEPGGIAADGAVAEDLAAVFVSNLADRNGQLLRRGLQQKLEFFGKTAPRFELLVNLKIENEAQGFRRDGTATRVRTVATGQWMLLTLQQPAQEVARGTEKVFDAYNIPDNQFFASDSSREAMERRLMESLSQEIVQRLALQLQRKAAG